MKKFKDQFIKLFFGNNVVPRGLFEADRYFRQNGPIVFEFKIGDDGNKVAISKNFRHGSIVTSGKSEKELDKNIKDAILTSFNIPSSYAREINLQRTSNRQEEYVLA